MSRPVNRIAGSSAEVAIRDIRRRWIPAGSTLAAILLALLPIVANAPLLPEFGFLVLIAWRLLRPEIWTARMAIPLGLANDLILGHPIGQSVLLWTSLFLVFDLIDSRLGFRDYWMDWLVAAAAIIFYTIGSWYIALLMGSDTHFNILWPQIGLSILFYPIASRAVVGFDRWRLTQ